MDQLIFVIVSFLTVPIFIRKGIRLYYALFISAGILGIMSRLGFKNLAGVILNVFVNPQSQAVILTVIMVSILGGLMKHYGFFSRIVETLESIVKRKRNILMIIPAMIGILVIPGGALLSAPFINDIGKGMNIPSSRRAAINLVFRHISMFILPYSTSLLIVSTSIPDINIFRVILFNAFFITSVIIVGYFHFIKDIQSTVSISRINIGKNILRLLTYTLPIYASVIINYLTGLPFYISLVMSVIIVYLISDKKSFFRVLIKSPNWNMILTVIAILIMKETILNMKDLINVFIAMPSTTNSISSTLIIFWILSFFFGYITGNQGAALAIVLPIISQMYEVSNILYVYIYFIFGSTFMGYFLSPIHLCQVFTLEYMNVNLVDLYREYRIYIPVLLLVFVSSVFIFGTIFI